MHSPIPIIVLFILIYTQPLQAQDQHIIDSLEQQLLITSDSLKKVELYHSITKQFLGINFEKAEEYERLAFQFCPKNSYKNLGNSYRTLAIIYAQTSRIKKALVLTDSAIHHYTLAKDTSGLVYAYGNKGGVYLALEEFQKGITYLYKSLKLNEKTGHTDATLNNLHNLSRIYHLLQDHDKMFTNSMKVLQLADSTNNLRMKAYAYDALGSATFDMQKFDSSLVFYQKAADVFKEIGYHEHVALAYSHISHIYTLKKQNQLALKFAKKAQGLESFISSQINLIELKLNIAHTYYNTGNYKQSFSISKNALQMSYSIGLHYQSQALNRLIKNMAKLKNFEQAYHYQSQQIIIIDSLYYHNQQAEILNLKTKYETEKIEQQNALLAKEKEIETLRANRNQQLLYLSILAIALILFISILLMRQYKTNAAHLTNQLKHRLLRNQMSPHFIFNSLVAIQNFVYKKAPIKAGEYLASFAQLIRAILENSMEECIPLEKEIQWLDNYLQLQLLRFDHSFDYTIDLDKNIDLENMLIPPMLTQPFIENALEHGLKDLDYRGKINIKMSLKDDILYIDVSDNGIGLDTSNARKNEKKHQSLALKITQERLHFLNKKRGKNIFFNMKNLDSKGTLISFSLPLNYKY